MLRLLITRHYHLSSRGIPTTYRTMATQYKAIIIGSGQGGTPLATAYAKAGHKTLLIERSHIGGCCINEGCTPTKTMIASGRVAYLTRRRGDYGVHVGSDDSDKQAVQVEMEKVRQRKRDIVNSFRGGSERRVRDAGIDLMEGGAKFVAPKEIVVKANDGSEKHISGENIFVNTGERPARPALPGLDTLPPDVVLDSTSIQELSKVPSHLLILGGGYIALEFGQLFRRLGAEVTIIQRSHQLLPREDPDIAASMLDILREDGINVHLSSTAAAAAMSSDTAIEVDVKHADDATEKITGSHLLLAAGRTPNTDSLNLQAAGIMTINDQPNGHIAVNDKLETNVPGVYALGDVKGGPAFTHVSYDDFRILKGNLLDRISPPLSIKDRLLPYVCFTDPQMAHVGLHLSEARAKFPTKQFQVAKMPMSYVARALEVDETRGMMKAVVDKETELILGFSGLGIEMGEVMAVVQMAMMGNLSWRRLEGMVFAHPTLAESLNNLWGFLEDV